MSQKFDLSMNLSYIAWILIKLASLKPWDCQLSNGTELVKIRAIQGRFMTINFNYLYDVRDNFFKSGYWNVIFIRVIKWSQYPSFSKRQKLILESFQYLVLNSFQNSRSRIGSETTGIETILHNVMPQKNIFQSEYWDIGVLVYHIGRNRVLKMMPMPGIFDASKMGINVISIPDDKIDQEFNLVQYFNYRALPPGYWNESARRINNLN